MNSILILNLYKSKKKKRALDFYITIPLFVYASTYNKFARKKYTCKNL